VIIPFDPENRDKIEMKINKIALFTIAVGEDPFYIDSVRRYYSYNKACLEQLGKLDYYLITDRKEYIDGITHISCSNSIWPYAAMLKNNYISDYLDLSNKWDEYTHIFFIDADFGLGKVYDYLKYEFVFLKPYWKSKIAGGFYGGKSIWFRKLAMLYYKEIAYIYKKKLSVPTNLDEFYLKLFYNQYYEDIHLIHMDPNVNTNIFFEYEDIEQVVLKHGSKLFLHPCKVNGRANRTIITDECNKQQEYTVNIEEKYIYNNVTHNLGHLLELGKGEYRILWHHFPDKREVLYLDSSKIYRQISSFETANRSPAISIVMIIQNMPFAIMQESIESVFAQTFADFELIIISDDSIEQNVIDWLSNCGDSRVRFIHKTPDFAKTINKELNAAKGKYLIKMDAEDIMFPDRLLTHYNFMEENVEIDVCGSWMEVFENTNNILKNPISHEEIAASLLSSTTLFSSTIIIRKSSVKKKGVYKYTEGNIEAENYKLWTNMIMKGYHFANIPEILIKRKCSIQQISKSYLPEISNFVIKDQLIYINWAIEYIVKKNSDLKVLFDVLINSTNNGLFNLKIITDFLYPVFLNILLSER